MPTRYRMRHADVAGKADRSTIAALMRAGLTDVANLLGDNAIETVPGGGFAHTEFPVFRSDYIMASQALANKARKYDVIQSGGACEASDHYPVVADFELEAG